MTNFDVFTSHNEMATSSTVCRHYDGTVPHTAAMDFACTAGPVTGRYVGIQLHSTTEATLTLCEIEAYQGLH